MKRASIVLAVLLAAAGGYPEARAAAGPAPPCQGAPTPAFPRLGAAPVITLWHSEDLPPHWRPPACIAWASGTFALMIGVAARFEGPANVDALLARIGAISAMKSVRYWSVTRKEWTALFKTATALAGPDSRQPRPDFTAAELRDGHDHFFLQEDNRSGEAIVSRLAVVRTDADGVEFEMANVTPVKWLLVTLYPPGALHSIYFVNRVGAKVWTYYSLSWIGPSPPILTLLVRPESYVNRAAALFRYLAGIPTDLPPPAAP